MLGLTRCLEVCQLGLCDLTATAVILYAKTNIGATSTLPFDILGNKLELDYAPLPEEVQKRELALLETIK